MAKVDRKIVEQEVNEMFDEHKTFQDLIGALLIETGYDASTIRANQEARQKKQEAISEQEEKKKEKKEKKKATQKSIQRLADEQKAEQVEDEKSRSGSRRTLPLVIAVDEKEVVSDEEPETEVEAEVEDDEVLPECEEIET
jgi:ribosome assembly protein YihI (activator of Der GTPase)